MHQHLVAAQVWLWRQGAPVAPLLQRIAAEQTVLVTTSASDWLDSDGEGRPRGGRLPRPRPQALRQRLAGGRPAAEIGGSRAPVRRAPVLHFAVPLATEGITVRDNWRTMGMRATGSNDVVFDGLFLPDAAVSSRRPKGAWVPFLSVVACVALPVICSAYLGIGEAARDLALRQVQRKRDDATVWYLAGEMENALPRRNWPSTP